VTQNCFKLLGIFTLYDRQPKVPRENKQRAKKFAPLFAAFSISQNVPLFRSAKGYSKSKTNL